MIDGKLEVTVQRKPYEKPVLLDLEEIVAGCGACATGGSNAFEDDDGSQS